MQQQMAEQAAAQQQMEQQAAAQQQMEQQMAAQAAAQQQMAQQAAAQQQMAQQQMAQQEAAQQQMTQQAAPAQAKPAGRKSKAGLFAVIGIVVVAVLGGAAWYMLGGKKSGDDDKETAKATEGAVEAGASAEASVEATPDAEAAAKAIAEMTPLYGQLEIPAIDLRVQCVTPGQKQPGITWDSTLFYWLEDVDQTSSEDGYLAKCRVTRTVMRDAQDNKLIEYEVYHDPQTDEIYKIVSIKQQEDELELVDYYYQGGVPNFMFRRTDTVYTPTYATPDKLGERYYFADNTMARWRIIREPRVIGEYVLTPTENVTYSQANYFTESDEIQQIYDDMEQERLNAAYNTYNAIVSQQSMGSLEGCVKDTAGTPMANVTVDVMRTDDNTLLYRTVTDENGLFNILTWLDGTDCCLIVRGSGEYRDSTVYDISLASSRVNQSYRNLVLYKESGNEYPVHINVFQALETFSQEDGTLQRSALSGVKATVREGAGAYTGEGIMTVEAGDDGAVTATLPSGTYTVQLELDGYAAAYIEVVVAEQETSAESYMLPQVPENTYGVVLVWDDPSVDLDLTLFTPYQSAGGDMAHIGGRTLEDGHGNRLVADNAAGCEVMYLNAAEQGSYKLYVNDYSDSVNGNYSADVLGRIHIRIYIYDANGLVAEYTCPAGQSGVVWEALEISGKQLMPGSRIYSKLDGKSWWVENKQQLDLSECENLTQLLNDMTHYTIGNGKGNEQAAMEQLNRICAGEEESLLYFWGLESEVPPHVPPVEKYELRADGYYYAMTREQMSYAAYSLTGKQISFENFDADSAGTYSDGTGVYFGGMAGDTTWNEMKHVETEYAGNGIWRVSGDVYYYAEGALAVAEEGCKAAEITFLVEKAADSCYDGFCVRGVESLKCIDWAGAYQEFLINDSYYSQDIDGKVTAEGFRIGLAANGYSLIHVDDDGIPELCVNGTDWASGDMLYWYRDGELQEEYFSQYGGYFVPRTGKAADRNGRMGGSWDIVYELKDGWLEQIGEGDYTYFSDPDDEQKFGTYESGKWNGQEVTGEQYNALLQECFDTENAVSMQDERYYIKDIDQLLLELWYY